MATPKPKVPEEAKATSSSLPAGLGLETVEDAPATPRRPDDEATATVEPLPEGYGVEDPPRGPITGPDGGAYDVVAVEGRDGELEHRVVAVADLRREASA